MRRPATTDDRVALCPKCKGVLGANHLRYERCNHCLEHLYKYSSEDLAAVRVGTEGVYSFCESTAAPPLGGWHLRKMTAIGKKLGGGVDTDGLCGFPKSPYGWDLQVGLTEHHLTKNMCSRCLVIYKEEQANVGV